MAVAGSWTQMSVKKYVNVGCGDGSCPTAIHPSIHPSLSGGDSESQVPARLL